MDVLQPERFRKLFELRTHIWLERKDAQKDWQSIDTWLKLDGSHANFLAYHISMTESVFGTWNWTKRAATTVAAEAFGAPDVECCE